MVDDDDDDYNDHDHNHDHDDNGDYDKQTGKYEFDCCPPNWVELRVICFETYGSLFQSRCFWGLTS